MFLCDTHASRFSTFSSPLFFVCRVRVLGMNWALAGGSECSNKQEAVLNPAAEGGWGRGQKLTQCALTERFSGNTSASEKWWLEMHLSSRVGYFKDEELIVADLRISLQVGHSFIIRARLVKYSEQACECIGLAKLGFRPSFFFLYAGTLFAWLFWRTWRWAEELGEAKLSLALFFFFPWKCRKVWKVSISSQYGMENCFSTWTHSWNGNKQFPAHFYSWFIILSVDFRLWSPNTFESWSLQETFGMVAHMWVKMEGTSDIKSIPHFPAFIFIVFLWPSTNTNHLREEKYDESLS